MEHQSSELPANESITREPTTKKRRLRLFLGASMLVGATLGVMASDHSFDAKQQREQDSEERVVERLERCRDEIAKLGLPSEVKVESIAPVNGQAPIEPYSKSMIDNCGLSSMLERRRQRYDALTDKTAEELPQGFELADSVDELRIILPSTDEFDQSIQALNDSTNQVEHAPWWHYGLAGCTGVSMGYVGGSVLAAAWKRVSSIYQSLTQ